MTTIPADVERFLSVGTAVVFETEPQRKEKNRHRTVIRGWTKGRSISMDRPVELTGSFLSLREGMPCAVRFLAEGMACSFDAEVVEWDQRSQSPCMRVSWPMDFVHTTFRKFERVSVAVPVRVRIGEGSECHGRLRDLSLGGCGAELPDYLQAGTLARLSFTLPDGSQIQEIQAAVRSCQPGAEGNAVGFQFNSEQEYHESDIAFYIRSTLDRQADGRASLPRHPTVLVIDSDAQSCSRIKRGAARHAGDVQLASNALDGIYKVREGLPILVAIRQDLPDLPGIEVCRLIRGNEFTRDIGLYLFGGDPEGVAAAAESLGVDHYFPEGERMLPSLIYTMGRTLSKLGE